MGKPDHVEHRTWRNLSGCDEMRLPGTALNTVADRAVLNTCIAFDAAGSLLHDRLKACTAFAECLEIMLPPLVAEFQHCAFNLGTDCKTFWICCRGFKGTCLNRSINEVCTLLGADLDKGCLPGLIADDTPITAGKICLAGNLHLAPAAVAPPAISLFFELID